MRMITPSEAGHMMYTNVMSLNEISILTPTLKSSSLNKDKGWSGVGLD